MEGAYRLSATEVAAAICNNQLTVEQYAESLLSRIQSRDPIVKAWAYLNPELVLDQARRLDQTSPEQRGPLHGVAVGVKDVIYTKGTASICYFAYTNLPLVDSHIDMPTGHNSPIYVNSAPAVDAASVQILRHAGALILGKCMNWEAILMSAFNPSLQGKQRQPNSQLQSRDQGRAILIIRREHLEVHPRDLEPRSATSKCLWRLELKLEAVRSGRGHLTGSTP